MTTRAQLLGRVHRLLNDTPEVQTIDELTGNASTTVFDLSNEPIEPASEIITVDGATQTRDTHYTIDNENGNVTFVTAPGDGVAVAGSFKNSYYSGQSKIDYLNEAITNHLFTETYDDDAISWLTTEQDYALPTDCKRVLSLSYYDTDSREHPLRRYKVRGSYLHILDKPSTTLTVGIRYLKSFISLATDAATTDLPTAGEECAVLYAAYALVRDREPLLARFDGLPATFAETAKASGVAMRPAQYYYDLFKQARAQANLSPGKRNSTRTIQ